MANVFGILTAIVLALSAFIAYQNKKAYENEISETANQKGKLRESEKRLKTAKDNLASTIAERTGVDEENLRLTGVEATQKKDNEDLNQQISAKTTKTAANKEQLDKFREQTSKIGDVKELASKMRQTNSDLEELAQSIKATDDKLANLTADNNKTEAHATAIKKKFETISNVLSLPTLNTRIRSIYPSWGFVTLAAGNNGGVVANSTLDVVRGSNVIAKLMVTAVESNSASASIIPDSMAQDVTLMVGDRVVPSQKSAAPQPSKN